MVLDSRRTNDETMAPPSSPSRRSNKRQALAMAGSPTSTSSASLATAAAASRGHTLEQEERAEERALTGILSDDTLRDIMCRITTRELLSSFAFVCRRWRRLCVSFAVYELVPYPFNPSVEPRREMNRRSLLRLAATHASTLERVHLHGSSLGGKDIIALCQSLPKLQDLAIIYCRHVGATDLERIIDQLPTQLIGFEYRNHLIEIPTEITDKIMTNLFQRCPLLRKVDLDMNSAITRLGGLPQACQSLTSLDLQSDFLGWADVSHVFSSLKSLCHFSLVSHLLQPSWEMEGSSVSVAGSLDLEMPKHFTSIRLYSTPYKSVPIELPPMLRMLQNSGHQLQDLHAKGVSDPSWQTISVWCTNLKLLDLTNYWQNSHILTKVEEAALCGLIQKLKKLERIALPFATDHVLTELGRVCSHLREIHVPDRIHPRNRAVTDRGVAAVAEGCPVLRVLSLSHCHHLTISAARALAFHCRQLKVLLLNGCDELTDDAVAKMLPHLSSSLVFLDLTGCRITHCTLREIRQYAKVTSLRVVAIPCSLWHNEQSLIAKIHKCNPRLQISCGRPIVWDGFYHGIHWSCGSAGKCCGRNSLCEKL